jgi:HD-GYP domain-containing protein (c-di-GMP phosphodiesterase class II)
MIAGFMWGRAEGSLLRVDIRKAKEGMTLALPVPNPNAPSRVLLKSGFALTDAAIQRVGDMGVRSLWVSYPGLSCIEQYLDAKSFAIQQETVTQIAKVFEDEQNNATARHDYDAYTTSIQGMIDQIASNPKSAVFIGDLAEGSADLIRHASAVTYLSVLLGLKLEAYMIKQRKHVAPGKAKEVQNLGLGAMLHDIGMTLLDEEALERFELDADESDRDYREHPALGFRQLRGQVDPSAAAVVLHHHQRYDGSGFAGDDFPIQQGPSIHVYTRIASVADQFDRLRHPFKLPPNPTVFVLNALLRPELAKRFDPVVLKTLYEVVPPYAPGVELRLSDGRLAVAVDHNLDNPCRPVVQILNEAQDESATDADAEANPIIDLAQQPPSLFVAECEGQTVADYNFSPEALKRAA